MKNLLKNGINLFYSTLFVVLLISSVEAQTFTGPGFTIVDGVGRNAASCSAIPVSGITSNTSLSAVTLINANHTFVGDLEIRLYPPGTTPPATTNTFPLASPPDATPCNLAGNYRFVDTGAQSIDNATTTCGDTDTVRPGDYRTSVYGGGDDPGATTMLATNFSNLTPAQINGTWNVCIFDFGPGDEGTVGSTALTFGSATAAGATISGKVTTAKGTGLAKTIVTVTDSKGISRTTATDRAGIYLFEEVMPGETYIISVSHRAYDFQSIVKFVSEDISDINFTPTSRKE